jgi:cytochrome c
LLIGPLVYFTLPTHGITVFMTVVILTGATFALGALGLMWAELLSSEATVGRFFAPIVCLIMLTGGCMGYGRHLYREGALMEHRDEMNRRTGDYVWAAQAAQHRLAAGVANDNLPLGARIYRDVCSSCHAVDRVLAAPPITEIATIYPDNPAGIVAWTKAPGRKRTEFSPMPAFANLSEKQLFAVADHMLELAQAAGGGNASDSAGTPH